MFVIILLLNMLFYFKYVFLFSDLFVIGSYHLNCCFFVCNALSSFFLFLVFSSLSMMYLSMVSFVFLLFEVHHACSTCKFISFIEVVKFLAVNFSIFFLFHFLFLALQSNTEVFDLLILSHRSC